MQCELEGVTRLRCAEGMLPAWHASLLAKLEGLRILNLSACQLLVLPPGAAPVLPADSEVEMFLGARLWQEIAAGQDMYKGLITSPLADPGVVPLWGYRLHLCL